MKVINNFIIFSKINNENTQSGIFLGESKSEFSGKVEFIDSKIKDICIGDTIVYDKSANITKFILNNKIYYAVELKNIICII